MSPSHWEWPRPTTGSVAQKVMPRGRGIINITEDVRNYAAEQGLAEEKVLKAGMAEKATEFNESGAELYSES